MRWKTLLLHFSYSCYFIFQCCHWTWVIEDDFKQQTNKKTPRNAIQILHKPSMFMHAPDYGLSKILNRISRLYWSKCTLIISSIWRKIWLIPQSQHWFKIHSSKENVYLMKVWTHCEIHRRSNAAINHRQWDVKKWKDSDTHGPSFSGNASLLYPPYWNIK